LRGQICPFLILFFLLKFLFFRANFIFLREFSLFSSGIWQNSKMSLLFVFSFGAIGSLLALVFTIGFWSDAEDPIRGAKRAFKTFGVVILFVILFMAFIAWLVVRD